MAEASIVAVKKFFKTGNPDRDNTKAFSSEWNELSDSEKSEVRSLVAETLDN